MTCLNNLRQWGVALNAYHNDYGAFPVGNVEPPDYYGGNWNGGWWAFKAKLLPYMEANNVCKLCNFTYSSSSRSWALAGFGWSFSRQARTRR